MKVRLNTQHKHWNHFRLFGDGQRIASCSVEQQRMGNDSYAHVWSVFVNEGLRGKKVGELLITCAVLDAYKQGEKKVRLYVHSVNKSARRCYEKVGFRYEREFPILQGDRIPPDYPYPERSDDWIGHYAEHRKWIEACTYAEVCPVPWINDVYEWTMTMHIELTVEKIAELKKRRKELRQRMVAMQA